MAQGQNLKKMYYVWYQGRFRKLKDGETRVNAQTERGVRDMNETLD